MFKFDVTKCEWENAPAKSEISNEKITIVTEPKTDYWQRTYYGMQNDNAPTFLLKTDETYFSFVVKTTWNAKERFDQCGVAIYQNSENWFKASIEYENEQFQRLGSVVTNNGYSDWATTDIPSEQNSMYYRLSRRESDFCVENSYDGVNFKQMRIFHLFEGAGEIRFGVYACSPLTSSFTAEFTEMNITECMWEKEAL